VLLRIKQAWYEYFRITLAGHLSLRFTDQNKASPIKTDDGNAILHEFDCQMRLATETFRLELELGQWIAHLDELGFERVG